MPIKKSNSKPKKLYLVDEKKKKGFLKYLSGRQKDVYEEFYKELTDTAENDNIDIIMTTDGGEALWCSKICYVLKNRTGKSRVFVKSYAHSAGTIIALAANELYITYDTTFSAIDAQGPPFVDLIQTSIQKLDKLVQDPRKAFIEISKERAYYFRHMVEKNLNTELHNRDLIMKIMHDETPLHEQLFFREDMDNLGIKYKLWDGKNIPDC